MISVGLRCHIDGIYCVTLEIDGDTRRILDHKNIVLGQNQEMSEQLYTVMTQLKTDISRLKDAGLKGVALKKSELASLRRGMNDAKIRRLYLEGCTMTAIKECGISIVTYSTLQTTAALETSRRIEGYVEVGEFREIDGLDRFPKTTKAEWLEATAVALTVLEGKT